jgi:hypothetical protein
MDNLEILKKMGFTSLTGNLWLHKLYGSITISLEDKPEIITQKIFYLGVEKAKEGFRDFIGIK